MIVRLQGDVSRRRVIKFQFDHGIQTSRRARRFGSAANVVAESMGLRAKPFDFDRIAVASSQSFHVEVSAPAQLEFTEARFLALDTSTGRQWSDEVLDPTKSEYVHMHIRIDAEHVRSIVGRVEIKFRAARLGLPLLGAGLTALIAAVLLAGWSRASQLDTAGGSALLLLGPTLLAALIVRPGEHALATRLLLGLRIVVALAGVASFVAAGALAAKYTKKLDEIWAVATMTACGCAAVLLLTQLLHPGSRLARIGAILPRTTRSLILSVKAAARRASEAPQGL